MFEAASRKTPQDSLPPGTAPLLHLYHPPHEQIGSPHHLSPHHASPSLQRFRTDGHRAFELKFLLLPEVAAQVEARLAELMTLDPHADPAHGNGYQVSTLYCDTPAWDVFHQHGRYKFFKLRLRRYGQAEYVFLERKAKRKDHVRKLRSTLAMAHLRGFAHSALALEGYGGWYHRQLRRNKLRPACLVEYQRTAYFGMSAEGPIRLTFDRQIHGGLADGWSFETPARIERVLAEHVVCEFKFRGMLPAMFKSAIAALQLTPGRVSKYRLCVQALGVVGKGSDAHA
jgi:hypothetical protein